MTLHPLMFGWEFPPQISGGLGMACYGIVSGLSELGIATRLVLPKIPADAVAPYGAQLLGSESTFSERRTRDVTYQLPEHLSLTSVTTLLHPYITERQYQTWLEILMREERQSLTDIVNLTSTFSGTYGPNLFSEVLRYAMVAAEHARYQPHDIIHAHDWLTILAGIEARKHSRKPLIFHVHALETDRSGEHLNQTIYDIERHGLEQADAIITVSHYTKRQVISRYGIAAEKIHVVHNGMFANTVAPVPKLVKQPYKTVLFLGRMTHQKGPMQFIDVAHRVLQRRQDVRFVMAGSGDLYQSAIERVAKYRIGRHVHFTGFLNRKWVDEAYRRADIYVMPSVSEPFGLTGLEALMHGIPVIISKQSGVSEVLKHAISVDFWDVQGMAENILALLEYPAISRSQLTHVQQEIEHLTWTKAAKEILDVYEKVRG